MGSKDHNWGTQESLDIDFYREQQTKDQTWRMLEKVENDDLLLFLVVRGGGAGSGEESNGTMKMVATVLPRRPGRVLLVSEMKRNV